MVNPMSNDGIELWQDEAKCADVDNSLFFERATEREAKRFCAACPVKGDCLESALVYDYYGVWGGLSYKERQRKYSADYRAILRDDYEESGIYNKRLKV